jgi:hypothetical protein
VTIRFTPQGCKVKTTCTIQPNGQYTESITLSVDPASDLSLVTEESAGKPIGSRTAEVKLISSRLRATRYGFELVAERLS